MNLKFKQIKICIFLFFLLLGFASNSFSEEHSSSGVLMPSTDKAQKWIEIILERVLEAGQLVYIQVKNLVDPQDVGLNTALQNHFQTLKQNPMAMAGLGLGIILVPYFLIRSLQLKRKRQRDLQELKDSLENDQDEFNEDDDEEFVEDEEFYMGPDGDEDEDEDYDHEEEMRKLHEKEKDITEKEKDTSALVEEVEEKESNGETISEQTVEESMEIAKENKSLEQPLQKPETDFDDVDGSSEEISMEMDLSVAEPEPESNLSSEKSGDEIANQLEEHFAILENEFKEVDNFLDEDSNKIPDENNSTIPANQDSSGSLEETKKETSQQEKDDALYDQEGYEDIEEMDGEFQKLKEEMEQTMQEISQNIVDEEPADEDSKFDQLMEAALSTSDSSDSLDTENILELASSDSSGDFTMSVEDILGSAEPSFDEPVEQTSEESAVFSDNPEPDEEHLLLAEELLKEQDNSFISSPSDKDLLHGFLKDLKEEEEEKKEEEKEESFEKAADIKETESDSEADYVNQTKDFLIELEEVSSDEPSLEQSPAEEIHALEKEAVHEEEPEPVKLPTPPIEQETGPAPVRLSALPSLSDSQHFEPEKAESYINKLQKFQQKLENRLHLLDPRVSIEKTAFTEDDFDFIPSDSSYSNPETYPERYPWQDTSSYESAKLNFERKKPELKKAYSMELLESFILLDNQKENS